MEAEVRPFAAQANGPGGDRSFQLSLPKLWQAFRHRKWLAMTAGVALAIAGAAMAWYFEKPKFTAVSTVVVRSGVGGVFGRTEQTSDVRAEEFHKTQAYHAKSRPILNAALNMDSVRGLNLVRMQDDPLHWLEKELQAGFISGTDILRLSLTGRDPEELPTLVNAIMDAYLDKFVALEKNRLSANLKQVEGFIATKETELKRLRKQMENLKDTLKTGDPQALTLRQKLAIEEASAMKREQSTLESDIRRLEAQLVVQEAGLQAVETEDIPSALLNGLLDLDPNVQAQRLEVTTAEKRLEDHRKLVTGVTPRLTQLEEELVAAKTSLEKIKLSRRPDTEARLRLDLKRKRQIDLAGTQEKLRVAESQLGTVSKEAARLATEADRIGTGSADLESCRTEIDQIEGVLKTARLEKDRSLGELQSHDRRVDQRQPAEFPRINQSSLIKSMATFSILGLLLGVLSVSLLEARSHKVHKTGDVRQDLGLHTLGELPVATKKMAGAYGKADVFVEAVNSLCTTLLCDHRLGPKSVIMVSSGNQREGKTFLSCHLAVGLSRMGRKTLLVDGDLRKPDCHSVFNVPNSPGLSEVIRGEASLNEAMQEVKGSELQILTAGTQDQFVLKALSNASFKEVLSRLRDDFDCIVIDSAPTMCVSDALLIGREADGVIQVVRPSVSDAPTVYSAYEKMAAMNIKFLGVVVNGIAPKIPKSSYYATYTHTPK